VNKKKKTYRERFLGEYLFFCCLLTKQNLFYKVIFSKGLSEVD